MGFIGVGQLDWMIPPPYGSSNLIKVGYALQTRPSTPMLVRSGDKPGTTALGVAMAQTSPGGCVPFLGERMYIGYDDGSYGKVIVTRRQVGLGGSTTVASDSSGDAYDGQRNVDELTCSSSMNTYTAPTPSPIIGKSDTYWGHVIKCASYILIYMLTMSLSDSSGEAYDGQRDVDELTCSSSMNTYTAPTPSPIIGKSDTARLSISSSKLEERGLFDRRSILKRAGNPSRFAEEQREFVSIKRLQMPYRQLENEIPEEKIAIEMKELEFRNRKLASRKHMLLSCGSSDDASAISGNCERRFPSSEQKVKKLVAEINSQERECTQPSTNRSGESEAARIRTAVHELNGIHVDHYATAPQISLPTTEIDKFSGNPMEYLEIYESVPNARS
ncbi:hypothetical protein CLF_111047 [Clonorchis sinensis]|uniref:Uncharacterized protein n=1 Tax=Clonorchis sinensis TaxID=79923 RepID=G7YU90_CLOSI|nr:hypothetical protein CLF_111047 [Clonorchis sinensis]